MPRRGETSAAQLHTHFFNSIHRHNFISALPMSMHPASAHCTLDIREFPAETNKSLELQTETTYIFRGNVIYSDDVACSTIQTTCRRDDLTYVDIAAYAYGPAGTFSVLFMIFANSLGLFAAYLNFIGPSMALVTSDPSSLLSSLGVPALSSEVRGRIPSAPTLSTCKQRRSTVGVERDVPKRVPRCPRHGGARRGKHPRRGTFGTKQTAAPSCRAES